MSSPKKIVINDDHLLLEVSKEREESIDPFELIKKMEAEL